MTAADRAIGLLGPLAEGPGVALVTGMVAAIEEPWAIGVDPGIAAYLAPAVAPTDWFQWLTLICGARYNAAYSEAQQRAELAQPSGWGRGTRAAMTSTVAATLTGDNPYVFISERDPDPSDLIVGTLSTETPDPAATLAAAVSQTPAGIVLTYETLDEQIWAQVADRYATWANVAAAYSTWADVAAG